MSKNREAVTCNGRAAFYAAMWDDIRQCAMNLGWAVALHGSLNSDMDIMAMPWTEDAVTFVEVVDAIVELFDGNELAADGYEIDYESKPFGRIVATIPILEDFHLDISTMWVEGKVEMPEKKRERRVTACRISRPHDGLYTCINLLYDDGYTELRNSDRIPRDSYISPYLFVTLTEEQVKGLIRELESTR